MTSLGLPIHHCFVRCSADLCFYPTLTEEASVLAEEPALLLLLQQIESRAV